MFGYNNEKIYAHVFLFGFRGNRKPQKKSASSAQSLLVPGPLITEMFFLWLPLVLGESLSTENIAKTGNKTKFYEDYFLYSTVSYQIRTIVILFCIYICIFRLFKSQDFMDI